MIITPWVVIVTRLLCFGIALGSDPAKKKKSDVVIELVAFFSMMIIAIGDLYIWGPK